MCFEFSDVLGKLSEFVLIFENRPLNLRACLTFSAREREFRSIIHNTNMDPLKMTFIVLKTLDNNCGIVRQLSLSFREHERVDQKMRLFAAANAEVPV